jgi:replicative DNA helicase
MSDSDRLPPHSVEAEQALLGCVLLSPQDTLPALIEQRFSPLWFYELRHQHLASVLVRLFERGTAIDTISVLEELRRVELADQIGGVSYLITLQDGTPSAANVSAWRDTVREKWKLRQIIAFATHLVADIYSFTGKFDDLLARAETQMETLCAPLQITAERHIKTVILTDVLPLIERHYHRGETQLDGLPLGEDWYLDKLLLGIAPTDYVVLAGRPGEGKTSLALNVVDYLATKYVHWEPITEAEHALLPPEGRSHDADRALWFSRTQGIPIGVFTLEMSEESLGFRLVFSHAQVSTGRFRQGFAEAGDFTAINAAAAALGQANIYLDGEADQSMDMIAAKARRMARQYGIKLFVLDYLQLLDSDDDSDRLRVLRRISKKLVSLKKRLQIPWLVLAQMNRNIETAERARKPVLSDLKESGSIEQDADKVIFLYHPLKAEGIEADEEAIEGILKGLYGDKIKAEDRPRRINAVVAKNRNGPTGTAQLLFQNNQCLFHDWRRWELAKGLVQKAAGERPPEQTTLIDPEDVP